MDGIVSERETLSVDVTVAPADEVVRVGTSSNGKEVASIGTFQKPYDGIITSYVGPRWGRTHNGIDIVADGRPCKGDPAYAAADGVVVRADWYGGYGNCVIIDHGDGIQTLYAHFSKLSVQVGDVVKAGDEVGKIGSTGNSTGPHLHFEVHVDGEIVNPLIFVDYE
ncbi:MAG: peptidoglycan DD-metalloendopeptidase family protein [Clostridia bacterium]|nr:peptidoglycan DD-metalloendopeptidase family protein [Clostridia bacterium]MBR6754890.1 peptidoglycan DD-metalloendopeptidase family protein [Clostridia bacterium]